MSALGQKQTLTRLLLMSALPPKADIARRKLDVRFVPGTDISCLVQPPNRHGRIGSPESSARRQLCMVYPPLTCCAD
jgi:hypothetical protein